MCNECIRSVTSLMSSMYCDVKVDVCIFSNKQLNVENIGIPCNNKENPSKTKCTPQKMMEEHDLPTVIIRSNIFYILHYNKKSQGCNFHLIILPYQVTDSMCFPWIGRVCVSDFITLKENFKWCQIVLHLSLSLSLS